MPGQGTRRAEHLALDVRSLRDRSELLSCESHRLREEFRQQRIRSQDLLHELQKDRIQIRDGFDQISDRCRKLFVRGDLKGCVCSRRMVLLCAAQNRATRIDRATHEWGVELDRRVALHIAGERCVRVPPFSTCLSAAARLGRRLEREGISYSLVRTDRVWYCTWVRNSDSGIIATGSGIAAAQAFCRAVLNLQLGRIRPVPSARLRRDVGCVVPMQALVTYPCPSCGGEISSSRRPRQGTICNSCAWRSGRNRRLRSRDMARSPAGNERLAAPH